MNILIIGGGGREHAIAWKAAQSPQLTKLYVAPGNAGTAALGENVALDPADHAAVVRSCDEKNIDLVIVGPEGPLADGLADSLQAAGISVFGPSRAAAQIEASKAFSKDFMARHNIPTAAYAKFKDHTEALKYLRSIVRGPAPAPGGGEGFVVIKASGLAAGKGVLLPDDLAEAEQALRNVMVGREFGAAGAEVVIEERLAGPEVTLLAFSDGKIVRPMVASQDHKRVFDGDQGPNTGGMGAYAPVPACPPEMAAELVRIALQPAIDGLRAEGAPFVGVLYGGFMLTAQGPRVIEFNCRFGDPEAQVVLPLLESDFLQVILACVEGRLDDFRMRWKKGAAACVVLASGGYPGKYKTGFPISGLEAGRPDSFVFHSGTKLVDGRSVTGGGRVLCVTGWGADVQKALSAAYERCEKIQFEGMHYRKDIGWRVLSTDS